MISTGELKKGATFEFEGQPCSVLDWQQYTADALVTLTQRSATGGGLKRRPRAVSNGPLHSSFSTVIGRSRTRLPVA